MSVGQLMSKNAHYNARAVYWLAHRDHWLANDVSEADFCGRILSEQ